MSDHEFENYLTLIGRLLRLNPTQRQAIGEELRDHFESRLAELTGSGFSHDQAVKLALEEFGDAAGLAVQFSNITQSRKRRIIMRCTLASVVGLAAVVFLALAIWPDNHAPQFTGRAVADPAADQHTLPELKVLAVDPPKLSAQLPSSTPNGPVPGESTDVLDANTENLLDQFDHFDCQGVALSEFVNDLAARTKLQFHFDSAAFKDAGLDPDTIDVTMHLNHVRLKTLLGFVLRAHDLDYIIDDGIIKITTKVRADSTLITRVYDCHDILTAADPLPEIPVMRTEIRGDNNSGSAASGAEKASAVAAANPAISGVAKSDSAQSGAKAAAPEMKSGVPVNPRNAADELIDIITSSAVPTSWSNQGGPCSIVYYKGLLIVAQSTEGHEEVAMILDQISSKLAARAHTH